MKKTDPKVIENLQRHIQAHPDQSLRYVAEQLGLSLPTVKRYGSGRSKAWRKGRGVQPKNEDRLWEQVSKGSEGCWEWQGAVNNSGYGYISWGGKTVPESTRAEWHQVGRMQLVP